MTPRQARNRVFRGQGPRGIDRIDPPDPPNGQWHAHLGPGVEHEFTAMKERIRSLHLHDNNGSEDQHLFPRADGGTIDWTAAMQLLRTRKDQYPLLLELREVPEIENPLGEIARAFDQLEALEPANV